MKPTFEIHGPDKKPGSKPSGAGRPWQRRPTLLHVFISSPGDCAEERLALRQVVLEVSRAEESRSRRIELRPLMWEDFPPGPAVPGDLQSRVDDLLERYGLQTYEIYLGMMKARIGTPTPRSRSGTVEELEIALERRRRTRLPLEILFYFLEGENEPQAEVVQFRKELGEQGFLYRTVESRRSLEQAVYVHLTRIVEEWFHWKNRLRRQIRSFRTAAVLAGALLLLGAVLGYGQLDRGGAVRVREALESQGPGAAAEMYTREAPYMLIHGRGVRKEINRAFLNALESSPSITEGLSRFEEWTATGVELPDFVDQGRDWLAPRLEHRMGDLGIDLANTQALEIWLRATNAGVWEIDSETPRRLLFLISARRLFESLIQEGSDPARWLAAEARPFEAEGLRLFAGHVLARAPDFAHWGTPRHRIAILTLARDWTRMEEEATRALQKPTKEYAQPEIKTFVHLAPEDRVTSWLGKRLGPGVEEHVLAQIVDAAATRESIGPLFGLMDLEAAGRLPRGTDTAEEIRTSLRSRPEEKSRLPARERLWQLATSAKPPHAGVLDALLTLASVQDLPEAERIRISEWLIRVLHESEERAVFEAAAIHCLAKLRTPAADAFLAKETEEHVSERTSFGFAQKAALIDALRARKAPGAVTRASSLARLARQQGREVGAPLADWPVQAAFLRLLAELGLKGWNSYERQVDEVLTRRVEEPPDFNVDEFNAAAAQLLKALPERDQLELLAFPSGIVSDEIVPNRWERRLYLLSLLTDRDHPLKPKVALGLLRAPVVQGDLRQRIGEIAADHGGSAAAQFFLRELERDPQGNGFYLDLLGRAGARQALTSLVVQWRPEQGKERIERALESAADLPKEAYCDLVRQSVGTQADQIPGILWLHGAKCRVRDEKLIAAATRQLIQGRDLQGLARACHYLAALGDTTVWDVLQKPEVRSPFVSSLREASLFDWITIAQEIPPAPAGANPTEIEEIATARRILFIDEGSGGPAKEPRFLARGRWVWNPLLAGYAGRRQESVVRRLLDLATDPNPRVDLLGQAEDARTIFQAYCLWLAASALEPGEILVSEFMRTYRLSPLLSDNNPTLVRGSAALLLAATCEDCATAE